MKPRVEGQPDGKEEAGVEEEVGLVQAGEGQADEEEEEDRVGQEDVVLDPAREFAQ